MRHLASSFFSKGGTNINLTKLDAYDYAILPGVIRIQISGTNDPDLVDILSEIERSKGSIYVEGRFFDYLDTFNIFGRLNEWFIDLEVIETT